MKGELQAHNLENAVDSINYIFRAAWDMEFREVGSFQQVLEISANRFPSLSGDDSHDFATSGAY